MIMASKSELLDLCECTSYKEFAEKLKCLQEKNKYINYLANDKSVPHEKRLDINARSQQRRGLFVETVVTWEKYVQKILKEAVETVFEIMLNADSAQAALGPSQSSRELFKQAMVHHIDAPKRKETVSTDDKPKKKIANLTKRESSTVELSVDLIVQPDLWKQLLITFKESQLKKCDHIQPPLFHGENGIDNKFKSLFDTSTCLSDIIIEMGPVRLTYIVKKDCHTYHESVQNVPYIDSVIGTKLVIDSSQSLNDILRLHYGARCVFSHGQADKIFQPGGALHNFPTKAEFQEQIGKQPGDYLHILYSYIQEYGREAWIYNPTLVNLQRFLEAVAFRLFTAISKWVYDEFGKCIWNFDPTKCYSEHLKDDLPVQPEMPTVCNTSELQTQSESNQVSTNASSIPKPGPKLSYEPYPADTQSVASSKPTSTSDRPLSPTAQPFIPTCTKPEVSRDELDFDIKWRGF